MQNQFSRTELLLGDNALSTLSKTRIAIFGIGGVGGYTAEALARSGIGSFDLIDDDKICLTNINRQIIATYKTVGRYKTEVMKERILDINPKADIRIHQCFYLPKTRSQFNFQEYDYVVDAVDTVTAKLDIIVQAQTAGTPVISCMGAGNKLNPSMFEVSDIYETSVCPLAKVMRRELKKRNVQNLKVVYSKEKPVQPAGDTLAGCKANCVCPPGTTRKCSKRRAIPGSVAFVPAVAGLIIAGEVIRDILHI